MSALAEALISAFDCDAKLTWATVSRTEAIARFAVNGAEVEITFTETAQGEWRVGFDVTSNASIPETIRILSGVFQAVQEFLEVRQPERLIFAAKAESMRQIYETYLSRQDSALRELGYRAVPHTKASPLVQLTLEKTSLSAWHG